ncbi:MAG: hypothetical protein JWP58_4670 [Hymenobacter sp.]|jgi:hypothetical protein|nr:hypothetical protein [Hymenobacter sp.]
MNVDIASLLDCNGSSLTASAKPPSEVLKIMNRSLPPGTSEFEVHEHVDVASLLDWNGAMQPWASPEVS